MDTLGGNTWYFGGSDYVWARKLNERSREFITEAGGKVLAEDLVPFGTQEFGEILAKIRASGAKNIYSTMLGSDGESFIKQWRAFGLHESTNHSLWGSQRPSCRCSATEGVGLYNLLGYFNNLDTQINKRHIEDYFKTFGTAAP
jgi:ABC-type branched-subunit amino acid transport system substrate-binding protein